MNDSDYSEMSCAYFTELLASEKPVPGGGGASALVGAVGVALGGMVANLTVGKKKYASVEAEIQEILPRLDALRLCLLSHIEEDAVQFKPLAEAYGIPKGDPKRAETLEKALNDACEVPLEIMDACCEAIRLISVLAEKGSVMAISDAGVAAGCCGAALTGAAYNVYINTRSMSNLERATVLNIRADAMIADYKPMADAVCQSVRERLR